MTITANHVVYERTLDLIQEPEQLDMFTDYGALDRQRALEAAVMEREKRRQKAVLAIKKRFGKNAVLKGMNMEDGATAKDRNAQIGGHKA